MESPNQPNSASTPSSGTFHLFANLATELRLKIWALAIAPRILAIRYLPNSDSCSSSNTVPALLHTSREARYEALRTYKLSFGTKSTPAQIYFASEYDTVYLPRYREMGYDETLRDFRKFLVEPDRVRWLGLDYVEVEVKRPWEAYDKAVLIKSFPRLEKIYLVLGLKRRLREGSPEQRHLPVAAKETEFVASRESPEETFRAGEEFRAAFAREDKMWRDMMFEEGKQCEPYTLPMVEVVSRRC